MAHILVVSQVFYPDMSAVSQVLTDLAEDLGTRGHEVVVYSSRFGYEDPSISFPSYEVYREVKIIRLRQTRYSKQGKLGRILNFSSFNIAMMWRLFITSKVRHDLIIGTTVPPFLSFLGLLHAKIWRIKYCFYAMDLQPELAIASGYLKKSSIAARIFMKMSDFVYRKSELIVALDRFMASHIIERGANPDRVKTIAIWPAMSTRYTGSRLGNPFRQKMKFGEKIVIMYSGNMAVVHPLDTLLEAALMLRNEERFLFVFIGGGVRMQDVEVFKRGHGLSNIVLLPLQPRKEIHISLGSADLQVVIQGDGCRGYTHPNKVYGAMFIGKPILYIGPEPSHISDILMQCPGNISVKHGAIRELVEKIRIFSSSGEAELVRVGERNEQFSNKHFSRPFLIDRLVREIESIIP
jgi:glycosyltransferase involved in cell wall biosynthesis